MPDLIKAYRANQDRLTLIGININDTPAEVSGYLKEYNVPYPVVIDNTGDLVYKYRVRGHPTSVFINRQGVITRVVAGLVTPETLEQEVARALQ